MAGLGPDGAVYVHGGVDGRTGRTLDDTVVLRPPATAATGGTSWTAEPLVLSSGAPRPAGRSGHGAGVYGGWLVIHGGRDASGRILGDLWTLDLGTGQPNAPFKDGRRYAYSWSNCGIGFCSYRDLGAADRGGSHALRAHRGGGGAVWPARHLWRLDRDRPYQRRLDLLPWYALPFERLSS